MAKVLRVRNADNTAWVEVTSSVPDVSAIVTQATTAAVAEISDSAPETLNTLNELAAALNDDANFATTVTNAIAQKPSTGKTIAMAIVFGG